MSIRLLNLEDVANALSLPLQSVRRLASQRRIPTVRVGRRVLVDEIDLRAFLDERREPARDTEPEAA